MYEEVQTLREDVSVIKTKLDRDDLGEMDQRIVTLEKTRYGYGRVWQTVTAGGFFINALLTLYLLWRK